MAGDGHTPTARAGRACASGSLGWGEISPNQGSRFEPLNQPVLSDDKTHGAFPTLRVGGADGEMSLAHRMSSPPGEAFSNHTSVSLVAPQGIQRPVCSSSGNRSPSPWGEGRDEGGQETNFYIWFYARPHLCPLPRERSLAIILPSAWWLRKESSVRFTQAAGTDSPSLWGEGLTPIGHCRCAFPSPVVCPAAMLPGRIECPPIQINCPRN